MGVSSWRSNCQWRRTVVAKPAGPTLDVYDVLIFAEMKTTTATTTTMTTTTTIITTRCIWTQRECEVQMLRIVVVVVVLVVVVVVDRRRWQRRLHYHPLGCRRVSVIGLDCEMVFTCWGVALGRVTLVDASLNVLLDELVAPAPGALVDANTRFSGLTSDSFNGVTASLQDIQVSRRPVSCFGNFEGMCWAGRRRCWSWCGRRRSSLATRWSRTSGRSGSSTGAAWTRPSSFRTGGGRPIRGPSERWPPSTCRRLSRTPVGL